MKSILREPTRQEKRNAHRRACSAAGMSIEDQEDWGTADPSEREEVFLINEIEGNDNAEKDRLTNDLIAEMSVVHLMERMARIWHEGTHRSGRLSEVPYIEHPAAVVEMLKGWGYNEKANAVTLSVAWGHDLLEDTAVGEERLMAVIGEDGIARQVVEGIRMLTFEPTVDPVDPDYWRQRAAHWIGAVYNASAEILPVMIADRICNAYDFYQCQEIDRARAYLGCADELFARISELKSADRIQETLDACRRIVYRSTLSERVSGFFKRTGVLVGVIRG